MFFSTRWPGFRLITHSSILLQPGFCSSVFCWKTSRSRLAESEEKEKPRTLSGTYEKRCFSQPSVKKSCSLMGIARRYPRLSVCEPASPSGLLIDTKPPSFFIFLAGKDFSAGLQLLNGPNCKPSSTSAQTTFLKGENRKNFTLFTSEIRLHTFQNKYVCVKWITTPFLSQLLQKCLIHHLHTYADDVIVFTCGCLGWKCIHVSKKKKPLVFPFAFLSSASSTLVLLHPCSLILSSFLLHCFSPSATAETVGSSYPPVFFYPSHSIYFLSSSSLRRSKWKQ